MWLMLGALLLISLASTTRESRAQGRRDVAKWNPLFIAVAVIGIAIILAG